MSTTEKIGENMNDIGREASEERRKKYQYPSIYMIPFTWDEVLAAKEHHQRKDVFGLTYAPDSDVEHLGSVAVRFGNLLNKIAEHNLLPTLDEVQDIKEFCARVEKRLIDHK